MKINKKTKKKQPEIKTKKEKPDLQTFDQFCTNGYKNS